MAFSELMIMKIKLLINSENVEGALHPVVSNIQPRLTSLYKNKQGHSSHYCESTLIFINVQIKYASKIVLKSIPL